MKILYVSSEAAPFCKTGGLGDVAGSLPVALAKEGAEVAVVIPYYRRVRERFGEQLKYECYDYVDLAWRHIYCGLFSLEKDGVTWYFLDNEHYFDHPELYGYMDDGERFAFFSRAVIKMLDHFKFWPDIISCNDWQTALVPIYLEDDKVREERLRSIKTVFTIHNIEYQGRFNPYILGDLFGLDPGWVEDGTLMMDEDVNLLKGAILCANAVTTVSPTYANELKLSYFAHRLEGIMRQCEYKLSGILNGIDTNVYNPATDSHLMYRYSIDDMSGKVKDKAALQQTLGLREDPDTPIVAMISRLVSHKGLDLVHEVMDDIMGLPLQFVILGKGDRQYEEFFHWTGQRYPGRMAVCLDYNENLSMSIYSGADFFLMPSRSEPCGLSQMIAMRYGTVPIVRETGGLRDTIQAYDALRDSGNGYSFTNYSSGDMLYVLNSAIHLYLDYPDIFKRLRQRAMECDFSWNRSAKDYMRTYAGLLGQVWSDPVNSKKEKSKKGDKKVLHKKGADEKKPVSKKIAEARGTVEEKLAEVKKAAEEKFTDAKETVESKFSDTKKAVEEKLTDAKETVESKFSDTKKAVEEKLTDAKETVESKFSDSKKAAVRTTADTTDTAEKKKK